MSKKRAAILAAALFGLIALTKGVLINGPSAGNQRPRQTAARETKGHRTTGGINAYETTYSEENSNICPATGSGSRKVIKTSFSYNRYRSREINRSYRATQLLPGPSATGRKRILRAYEDEQNKQSFMDSVPPQDHYTTLGMLNTSHGDTGSRFTYYRPFKITAYTAGPESCGKRPTDALYGITATGTTVTEGVTVASDWRVLPPGTVVFIDGVGLRTVEDKGGKVKGYHIDVYMNRLKDARNWGKQYRNIWILEGCQMPQRSCYITEPTGGLSLYLDCPYDEGFNTIIKSFYPYPAKWDHDRKRWEVAACYKRQVIDLARQFYDKVFYATDGDYTEL
jgi:3D (Asp-Asp-Asp) domain-containing protein